MRKFILLSTLLFLSSHIVIAETALVPTCPCNDISSQIKTDKKIEAQTKHEMVKMDEDAQNLENQIQSQSKQTKHKKNLWIFSKK